MTENIEANLAVIGVLAHELGHLVAYPKDRSTQNLFNPSKSEIEEFRKNVLWPFFSCYAQTSQLAGEAEMFAMLHFQETRSDAFAYYVLQEVMKKNNIQITRDKYNAYINLFMTAAHDKARHKYDPHPTYEQRSRILTGECKLRQISPYYLFDEVGDIRNRF